MGDLPAPSLLTCRRPFLSLARLAGFGHVSFHFEPRRNADVLVLRRYREAAERHRRAHSQLARVHHPIPHLRQLVDVALVGAARGGASRLHVRRNVGGGNVSRAQNSSAWSDGDHGQCARRAVCFCDSFVLCEHPCPLALLSGGNSSACSTACTGASASPSGPSSAARSK